MQTIIYQEGKKFLEHCSNMFNSVFVRTEISPGLTSLPQHSLCSHILLDPSAIRQGTVTSSRLCVSGSDKYVTSGLKK